MRGRRSSSRSDLKIVERIITVADVVVIIISILGEGVLLAEDPKGTRKGGGMISAYGATAQPAREVWSTTPLEAWLSSKLSHCHHGS